ncbi:MAG: Stp1/IreP family PP2C-type Ser/Thr phosphatase [Desulforhabdus sp.]|jgi:protein phosphatase|nr:Stp1/IreP family PP2C-type Ser/Thr phosphatase [Desulforhabdus sp.]
MLTFQALGRSDRGRVRQVNEDAFLIEHLLQDADASGPGILAIVADGVGGHAQGELASSESVRIIRDEILDRSFADGPQVLKNAVEQAHRHLLKLAMTQQELVGMGTTCTVAWIGNSQAYVAQVGDSRAYLVRNGVAVQITEDQTLVQKLMKEGVITRQEAAQHPQKNMILQALGISENLQVELFHLPLKQDDTILLCTDGLHNLVKDSEISQLAADHSLHDALSNLINLANERGGFDNITAVVVREGSRGGDQSKRETNKFRGRPFPADTKEAELAGRDRFGTYLAAFLAVLAGVAFFILWRHFN